MKALTLFTMNGRTFRFEQAENIDISEDHMLRFSYTSVSRPGVRVNAVFDLSIMAGYAVDA